MSVVKCGAGGSHSGVDLVRGAVVPTRPTAGGSSCGCLRAGGTCTLL